ncbi:MAG TPA: hypothetical protein VHV10_08890, partial [Ktedonobacteraceae bacterium]|nr:hypothetical protein [Ktedonobacteraceae bacterium]
PYPPVYGVTCTTSGNGLKFPCSDTADPNNPTTVDAAKIQKDWLSGDGASGNLGDNIASNGAAAQYPAGHLTTTYNEDTVSSQLLQKLFGIMEAVGFLLITPIAILIGYHLLWASWTYRNVAIMESLGRLVLGVMAIGISYQLVTMLIGLVNLFNHGVIMLHIELPYSGINASTLPGGANGYLLHGDNDVASFRGVVQPITRWGCTINIFLGILSSKFATDLVGAVLPIFGGMVQLFGRIKDASEMVQNIGNFMMLLFSINLCVQIFVRIIFLNYYIVTAPVVFACWAMPGGTGVKIMGQWTKGILSILFTQTVQLFVLTTMPILVPAFPPFPGGAWQILNVFFNQLPPILVLIATIQVPKLMGTGATKATAQAGTVAAGAVAALGAAAYNIV